MTAPIPGTSASSSHGGASLGSGPSAALTSANLRNIQDNGGGLRTDTLGLHAGASLSFRAGGSVSLGTGAFRGGASCMSQQSQGGWSDFWDEGFELKATQSGFLRRSVPLTFVFEPTFLRFLESLSPLTAGFGTVRRSGTFSASSGDDTLLLFDLTGS